MRRIALVAVLLGLLAAVARPAGARPVVIYGYPLATRCPAAGIAEAVDRWGMFACNCTSYVAWALAAHGQRPDWLLRGALDPWNRPHAARRPHLGLGPAPRSRG